MPWMDTQKLRDETRMTAMGLTGEAFPLANTGGSSIAVGGTIYAVLCGFKAGDVVTNIVVEVSTVAVGMTLSKVGIYDTTGARLATSADLTTSWQNLGERSGALTAPYTILATGAYFLALVGTTATTMPTFRRLSFNTNMTVIGSGALPYAAQTGQTDLIANATLTAGASTPIAYWMGWN